MESDTARLADYVIAPKQAYETPTSTVRREQAARYAFPSNAYTETFAQYLPALLFPPDGADLSIASGQLAELKSRRGRVQTIAEGDAHLRPGTISISHGFGRLGVDDDPKVGFNISCLLGADGMIERYSGQPLMSNVPLMVRAVPSA
ncbi:molybdopterin dinucleotide binding domain-containing protein [Sphingobium sp.]|uniref:molybdopterin dinucleotide binding domain-containing protein n=1 Tax=Sphingobium sp. TaxID=1912891 RepID=UPI002C619942|nr:molybdopterin dinucleotide binding domain-containing protein [Sphingobium sp.]HUD94006.1 molybdopterin dinucleotide binding domain-containing protein [Sphingobium sp.]